MAEERDVHYIADDLGIVRDYRSSGLTTDDPKQRDDWLADADIDISARFKKRLAAEYKMDEFDD